MPHIPGHAVSATEPLPQALAPLAALRPYHWFWTVCPGYHAEQQDWFKLHIGLSRLALSGFLVADEFIMMV
jgi:hypothetical protein